MQFGVCGGPDVGKIAANLGYDYLESSVGTILKPTEDEAAFKAAVAAFAEQPLPVPVVNCFVPGNLKITGPDVDFPALEAYVDTVCSRAAEAKVEVIVFGSGGARQIPEGFDRAEAEKQLVAFGKMVGPTAGKYGVTVVVEPLNAKECNVLTTVGESARYVREVDHPNFQLLVDGYHWGLDNDSAQDVIDSGPLFQHTHIATWPNRQAPGAEACDMASFFNALKESGYDGRVSIEGRLNDPNETLAPALACMKELAG